MNATQSFYDFSSVYVQHAASIRSYLELNRIVTQAATDAVISFDNALNIEDDPSILLSMTEIVMKECAQELIKYFEKTFCIFDCLEDDLVKGVGYANLASITSRYYSYGTQMERRIGFNADIQRQNAQRIAESKVTGLSFGIISNSLASHLIYLAQNEAEIKRQTKDAEKYLAAANAQIESQSARQLQVAQKNYYRSTFVPEMRSAIPNAYADMLTRSVAFLGKHGAINVQIIKIFDYDRSESILEKLADSAQAESIIGTALKYCPYNIHAYGKAKQLGVFNENLQELATALNLDKAIYQEVGMSMIDGSMNCDKLDIEIAKFVDDQRLFTNDDDDWHPKAQQFLAQAKKTLEEHEDSYAAHGAYAAFLVAANIDNQTPTIWDDVQYHIIKAQELFFQRERMALDEYHNNDSGEDTYFDWTLSHIDIMGAFNWFCQMYANNSYFCASNDTWCCAPNRKKWKMTADCKHRLIPLIHTVEALISHLMDEREQYEEYYTAKQDPMYLYSKKYLDDEHRTVFDVNTYNVIDKLRGDLLWYLYVFVIYNFDYDAETKASKYYHLPLSERNFAIKRFDELVSDESAALNTDGWYRYNRKPGTPDIFRAELSAEGLQYYGITPPTPETPPASSATNNSKTGGCYIATAVYGSYDCPQVWTLRRYRDYSLSKTWYGRVFIRSYYAISPALVRWFGQTSWFKHFGKRILDRMVKTLKTNGFIDTPYNDKRW